MFHDHPQGRPRYRRRLHHGAEAIRSTRGGCLRPTSVVNWVATLFAEIGYQGCSSHSGRRTFITSVARNIHRTGCSLRDVRRCVGPQADRLSGTTISLLQIPWGGG